MSSSIFLINLAFIAGLAIIAGLSVYVVNMGRRREAEVQELTRTAELNDMRRTLRDAEKQNEMLRQLEKENDELALFFVVSLPDLIRQLNTHREESRIAELLLRMLDLIFAPGQACIFSRSRSEQNLRLIAGQGLPDNVDENTEVSAIEGPIGWVARHQAVMSQNEVSFASAFEGSGPADSTRFDVDLCAPLIDPDNQKTLGVMTVGSPTKHQRYMKKMIKMVADLGSLALKSSEYYRHFLALANQDGLTRLYSKRFGTDQLALALNEAVSHEKDLSVFLFDIDHFKKYNDTNGHLAGDEVLRRIGSLLKDVVRSDDFAVRFGGEEFMVVFREMPKKQAVQAAERIRRLVEEHPFPHREKQPGGRVTISGGVASLRFDARSSKDLIQLADQALYESKESGRNRVGSYRASYLSGDKEPDLFNVESNRS